jgi:UDP-glucuronate 4-epimerase
MRVLLTGTAGFIGFHLARALIARGDEVLGLDNLNSYYDPKLKHDRLAALGAARNFRFAKTDLVDYMALEMPVLGFAPEVIVHLAAQAGVRYSLIDPVAYADANVRGQVNMLELARSIPGLRQMVYASSSSVYGRRTEVPFRETDRCDHPASVYAATKRAGELLSDSYASLYGLSLTGLRFFTVYGPWGRPDMAYWSFTDAILKGEPIQVFNEGRMRRDFTDVRDVVAGLTRIIDAAPKPGHELYNIGHSEPVELSRFIAALESATGKSAIRKLMPMQPGDVCDTYADVSKLERDFGVKPQIAVEQGLAEFVAWFRTYKGL